MNWLLQKFVLFFQFLLESFNFSLLLLVLNCLIAPTFGCLLFIEMYPGCGAVWSSLGVPVLLPVFVRYLVIILLEMTLITCRALIGCFSDKYNVFMRTAAAMVRARALVDQSVVVVLDASFRMAIKKVCRCSLRTPRLPTTFCAYHLVSGCCPSTLAVYLE